MLSEEYLRFSSLGGICPGHRTKSWMRRSIHRVVDSGWDMAPTSIMQAASRMF